MQNAAEVLWLLVCVAGSEEQPSADVAGEWRFTPYHTHSHLDGAHFDHNLTLLG